MRVSSQRVPASSPFSDSLNVCLPNGGGSFSLPGKGKKGKNCGKPFPLFSCQYCHQPHFILSRCNQAFCPSCYKNWLGKRRTIILTRLSQKRVGNKRLLHIVVSPDKSLHGLSLKNLKKKATEYLQSKSIYLNNKNKALLSGVWFFHPYRPTKKAIALAIEEEKKGMEKVWTWILKQENWRDYIYYSPHFHFLGYAGYLLSPKKNEDFIYKTICFEENEKNHPYDFRNDTESLAKVIYYNLTHAGIELKEQERTKEKKEEKEIKEIKNSPYSYCGVVSCCKGESKAEKKLKEYIKKQNRERKKKNNYCRRCYAELRLSGYPEKEAIKKASKLWYLKDNLKAFLKIWLKITQPNRYKLQTLEKKVRELNYEYKENVIKCLYYYFSTEAPPPPEPEVKKYLIN